MEKLIDLIAIILSIYLALSIEGWAEKKNEQKKLIHYYRNISDELIKDTVSLSEIIIFTQKQLDVLYKQIDMLRFYKPEYQDSVISIYQNMLTSQIFSSSSMVSYQSMVVSGDIKLIEKLEIRDNLIELKEAYESLKLWEDLYMDFFRNELMNSYYESFDMMETKIIVKDYFTTPFFRNLVVKYYSFNKSRLEETKAALVKAKGVLAVLSKELEKE